MTENAILAEDYDLESDIEVEDELMWDGRHYRVLDIGKDLSTVPGDHVRLRRLETGGRVTVRANLVDKWLDEEDGFYLIGDGDGGA